jgi:hypothetical protein
MTQDLNPQKTTAGFRNAEWTMSGLPENTSVSVYPLRTQDGAACNGFLYWRGKPKTVVCIMHPREFLATHYLIPDLVEAGFAAFTQTSRSVGNDLRLEHEVTLLDVAAGLNQLRDLGFEKIVLLGNSGGASLYTFYNQQACLEVGTRLTKTPGGRTVKLNEASLPVPDGMAYVSPHPGQGIVLLNCIDPSVIDEGDAFSIEESLDPLNSENGFVDPPESSSFEANFVESYRRAQGKRVAKLDEVAKDLIATRMAARKRFKSSGDAHDRVLGAHTPVMTIWRTAADLRYFDLSLDPSERKYGSVWGQDPYQSNYGNVGFARFCSPESWLSTWSGLSSKAEMAKTAPSVEQPSILISYSGDNTVYPSDTTAIYGALASSDKVQHRLKGDHHGHALTEGEEPGRIAAGKLLTEWLGERFPADKE